MVGPHPLQRFRVKVVKFKVPDGQCGEREVYWFETVDFERPGSMKFQSPAGVTYEASCAFAPAFAEARLMFACGHN